MISEDYAKVGVPMLPVVADSLTAARQIWAYTLVLIPATFLLIDPLQVMGAIYSCTAFVLGAIFIKKAWALLQAPEEKQLARSLFLYSILYMMLLCAAMVVDSLPITHQLTELIIRFVSG